jgi:hypothetical protein
MFNNDKKIQKAISFIGKDGKYQKSPISKIKNEINGALRFAITKDTSNGRWVNGDLLFYEINGVSIYTDLNNVIFVNLETDTMFIRNNGNVSEEINPSDPEKKEYIVLYTDLGYEDNNEEFPLRWESFTGRTNVYNAIKANIEVIDIDKSIVLAETVNIKDALSVREFMNYIKNANLIEDDEDFDINEYSSEYI